MVNIAPRRLTGLLYKEQELLQYHPLVLRRGGVYPRPSPGHLPERVGIKPTPTDGDGLERYLHKLMRCVQIERRLSPSP